MAKDVLCIECNKEAEDFQDDNEDDLLSLAIGLGVTGGKQPVAVAAAEGVVDMTIEYDSMEYAIKEKWTAV